MAVKAVIEQGDLRTGSKAVNSFGDSVRVFLVYCTTGLDDDSVTLYANDGTTSIPNLYDAHPTRLALYCSDVSCRWVDGAQGLICQVTATYSYIKPFRYPWDEPQVGSWSTQDVEHPIDEDVDTGEAIVNSAGQPFDPAVEASRGDAVYVVSRNELDPPDYSAYIGTVNAGGFGPYPAGYAKLGISAQQQIYTDDITGAETIYYAMTYTVQCKNPNYPGWNAHVLDAGFCKLGNDGQLITITIGGREPSSPVPLNGAGGVLGEDEEPVFLDFTTYPESDFDDLELI